MDGLQRRPSGIYVVRLAVPGRLQGLTGRRELIRSTGTRNLAVAKIVGSECLAAWRRQLFVLGGNDPMDLDLLRLAERPAALGVIGEYLALAQVHAVFGMPPELVLRAAQAGTVDLYVKLSQASGYEAPWKVLDREPDGGYAIPHAAVMPSGAVQVVKTGTVELDDSPGFAAALLKAVRPVCVALQADASRQFAFVPDQAITLSHETVELKVAQLERLRSTIAAEVNPDTLRRLREAQLTSPPAGSEPTLRRGKPDMRWGEAVEAYLGVRSLDCAPDQARRIRGALMLVGEALGDPLISSITEADLETFRDKWLPKVPANENKIRLQFGTTSVTASIAAVAGTDWPTISAGEQLKRLEWVASMFAWLVDKGHLGHDPSKLLVRESRAKREAKKHPTVIRSAFEPHHLQELFGSPIWFKTGAGELTAQGTYREFLPYYYWLPLIGLFTGARINEIAQLHLADIKVTAAGCWYFDFNDGPEDGEAAKKLKTKYSRRQVPIHTWLIEHGLLNWRAALEMDGHVRLFPELLPDEVKGHGKAATKWFSSVLRRLGWERNSTLTFHSFRSTLITSIYRAQPMLPELTIAQLSGHSRPSGSALRKHYLKDAGVDELKLITEKVHFDLPEIGAFDCERGLAALQDALRRKRSRRSVFPT